jgi:hypothetical protein
MLFILVPYQDTTQPWRKNHLKRFLAHMRGFLYGISHHMIIANQPQGKFNRGATLNGAFVFALRWAAEHGIDTNTSNFCFHDVDLLPRSRMLLPWYSDTVAPDNRPVHIGRAWTARYDTDTYLGGILTMPRAVFESINGFPISFRGWGGEDDELRERLAKAGISVTRVRNSGKFLIEDLEKMDLAVKLNILRLHREVWKCNDKWEQRDRYRALRASGGPVDGLREFSRDWRMHADTPINCDDHVSHVTVYFSPREPTERKDGEAPPL